MAITLAFALTFVSTVAGCADTSRGKTNKAAGKQTSPAAGRIIAKSHVGKVYWILIKNKGKSRTVNVTAHAFDRCHVDRWYPTCN